MKRPLAWRTKTAIPKRNAISTELVICIYFRNNYFRFAPGGRDTSLHAAAVAAVRDCSLATGLLRLPY